MFKEKEKKKSPGLFDALSYNLQRNLEGVRVNSFTERSFKTSFFFSSSIRFHYLPDNHTLLHSHTNSVKDLNLSEYL